MRHMVWKRPGVWPGRIDAVIILKLHTGSYACLSQIDLFPGTCCDTSSFTNAVFIMVPRPSNPYSYVVFLYMTCYYLHSEHIWL